MPMESLKNTRGVWPFESNSALSFLNQPEEIYNSPASVREAFSDAFEEVSDLMATDTSHEGTQACQEIIFRVDTDMHSDILIAFIKQFENSNLSDRIVIQDRLFGKVRNEYVYLSTDGRGGDIVKIHCGDIAATNQAILTGREQYLSVDVLREEQPATIQEIETILDYTVMGTIVDAPKGDAEELNYPHPDRIRTPL